MSNALFVLLIALLALISVQSIKIELPELPYSYEALEPVIDRETMRLHHSRHHQAYANNCQAVLDEAEKDSQLKPMIDRGIHSVLVNLEKFPQKYRPRIANNCGGFLNHNQFWKVMKPVKRDSADGKILENKPTGELAKAISSKFGSFDNFKKEFTTASLGVFGSGWSWLECAHNGDIRISTTPNQYTPVNLDLGVVLMLDVWEHAYYLKYKNLRADYVNSWWDVVNWDQANKWYVEHMKNIPKNEL